MCAEQLPRKNRCLHCVVPLYVQYSGRFSLVQNFTEMSPDPPEEIWGGGGGGGFHFVQCESFNYIPTK